MEAYAFATSTDKAHYEYFHAQSLEALYRKSRMYFPIRSSFEAYFRQAEKEDSKYLIMVAPEPDDDYFEIILGNSRAVAHHVYVAHIKALENKGTSL